MPNEVENTDESTDNPTLPNENTIETFKDIVETITPPSSKISMSRIISIQLLCTIVVVLALYIFANQIMIAVNDKIDSLEYSKVG